MGKKATAPGQSQDTPEDEAGEEGEPKPKLLAGKYKTVEELESAHKGMEQRLTDLSGRLETAEKLLSVLDTEPEPARQPPPPQPDPVGSDVNFAEAFPEESQRKALYQYGRAIAEDVAKAVTTKIQGYTDTRINEARNAQAAEKTFYSENEDLTEWGDVVGMFAAQVQSEYAGRRIRNPEAARTEVARRTREYIKSLEKRLGRKSGPPKVIGGSSSSEEFDNAGSDEEEGDELSLDVLMTGGKHLDPRSGVDDWMNESEKFRAKRRLAPK